MSRKKRHASPLPSYPAGDDRLPKLPEELPEAFLARMERQLSEDDPDGYARFLSCYRHPPVHALLLNTLRGACAEKLPFTLSAAPVPWEPDGYYFELLPDNRPGKHPLHEAGAYYIQEPSAMLPVRAFFSPSGPGPAAVPLSGGLSVLDLCAAPGGKSTQLAMLMQGNGVLVSNEIHPVRAKTLSRNIERMGIRNAVVTNETPERLSAFFPAFFDRILVDAPCSGEGMFRKNPAAVREWSPQAVDLCAVRQEEILRAAVCMLAPGGLLVYSTCTFAPKEDEEQVERFLSLHPDFVEVKQEKLLPHKAPGEGHFFALLSGDGVRVPNRASTVFPDRRLRDETSAWIENLLFDPACIGYHPERLFLSGEHLYLLPQGVPDLKGLRVLRPGLHLADLVTDRNGLRFSPAHALSHVLLPAWAKHCIELNDQEAALYLNGQSLRAEALPSSAPDASRDLLVTYGGFSLGWAKAVNGQLKNHYPKGLRGAV